MTFKSFLAGCAACFVSVLINTNSAAAADSHGGHGYKTHMLGLFGGATSINGETNFTLGAEYEYRFNQYFGAGALFEHTPDAHHGDGTSIYMGLVHFHPYMGLRLSGGYGREIIHHHGSKEKDVWRIGAAYDFHIAGFGVAPTVNLDRIDGHTGTVFGLVISKSF